MVDLSIAMLNYQQTSGTCPECPVNLVVLNKNHPRPPKTFRTVVTCNVGSWLVWWVGFVSTFFPRLFFQDYVFLMFFSRLVFSGGLACACGSRKNNYVLSKSTNMLFQKETVKNAKQHPQRGGAWATQIFNNMFVGGVFYWVLLFWMELFHKSL